MNPLPLFHPSTGFTRSTSGPRAVQISTQRAQPIHLCSSTSGIIAIGIYYFTTGAYVRNYLNATSNTKQCYKQKEQRTTRSSLFKSRTLKHKGHNMKKSI